MINYQKLKKCLFYCLCLLFILAACHNNQYGPRHVPVITRQKSPRQITGIDWSREIIYFLLIDRFCNGDTTNDSGTVPASHSFYDGNIEHQYRLKSYQGGDLQGVIDKLDYLEKLGITTIWLSPVIDNSDSSFMGWWPYHGYHPVDFFKVDEHFGTLDLLKKLIANAHERGIKVLLDLVFNQVSNQHPWIVDAHNWHKKGYKYWFHPHSGVDGSTSIQNWQDQWQLENRELHGMPDLAQENPHVYEFLLDLAKYWIVASNCDGFRLDAVKHIPKDFWIRFCQDIHNFAGPDFLLLGEVFDGNTHYVAGYDSLGLNALFDIPMYFTIKRVFAQGGSTQLLSDQLEQNQQYNSEILMSTLVDNHDVARFSYWAGSPAKEKLRPALTFALSMSGIPVIYYGTEVALEGAAPVNETTGAGQDYLNRLMLPWHRINGADADLVKFCEQLFALRRSTPALQRGKTIELYKDYGVYAYLRAWRHDDVLIILNTSSYPETRTIPLVGSVIPAKTILTDVFTEKAVAVVNNQLAVTLAPYSCMAFRWQAGHSLRSLPEIRWNCQFTPRLTRDYTLVRFQYLADKNLNQVALAGDFNGWSPNANPMTKDTETGAWIVDYPLRPGSYRYKFVLNNTEWIHDPNAGAFERDPYGQLNSVIMVGGNEK